jgi:hypothetical protein
VLIDFVIATTWSSCKYDLRGAEQVPGVCRYLHSPKGLGEWTEAWAKCQESFERLLTQFKVVRADQIALLQNFDAGSREAIREAVRGPVTLFWVVSKTYLHTAGHRHAILRMAFLGFLKKRRLLCVQG